MTDPSHVTSRPESGLARTTGIYVERIDRHPAVWLLVLIVLTVLIELRLSFSFPLWHDELFSYVIAQAPSLREMYAQINATDMNPPLSYLLTRWSFHLFGVGTLQCRLPEIAGFLLAVVCVYQFVRRRLGSTYGFLAASLLLGSEAVPVSYQARPYGLLLGLTSLALVAWQGSSEASTKRRALGYDGLLFLALCLILLTHIFGLIGWGAVAAAELVSIWERRRPDPGRLSALLLPLGCTVLYRPFFQLHARTVYPPVFQPHPNTIYEFYVLHTAAALDCLLLTTLVLLLCGKRSWLRGGDGFGLSRASWVAILMLVASPGVLMIRLWRSHGAFFARYGILCTLAISIAAAAFLYWWTRGRPYAALIAAVIVLVFSRSLTSVGKTLMHPGTLRRTEPVVVLSHLPAMTDPSLPIVDASGLTFVEMNLREPKDLLSRVYYLTGGQLAVQYSHATIFEIMGVEKEKFHFAGQVEPYEQFVSRHRRFYVLGDVRYPEDWLLAKLMADHARLLLVGEDKTNYKDSELYEVELSPGN